MYDVLLAVDEDEQRALAQARAVADLPADSGDLHAIIFHVFAGDNPEGASVGQLGSVRRARDHLEDRGVEVTLDESSGTPGEVVLDAAEEYDADLIAVAGRRRSPTSKAILGSVSQEVLLNADRPVLFAAEE